MTLRKNLINSLAAALFVLTAGAGADTMAAVVDYVGFGWETGAIAESLPGDELAMAFVVTDIDALFGVDLGMTEGTVYIDGLISQGGIALGGDLTTITYSGGTLRLYADSSFDSDWGTYPANGTVPSTFVNGELVFEGTFTAFTLVRRSAGGVFEGFLNGTGGSALGSACTNCAYTFGGTFEEQSTGAQIPAGYDLQIDGMLDVENAVAAEPISLDGLKSLYR